MGRVGKVSELVSRARVPGGGDSSSCQVNDVRAAGGTVIEAESSRESTGGSGHEIHVYCAEGVNTGTVIVCAGY